MTKNIADFKAKAAEIASHRAAEAGATDQAAQFWQMIGGIRLADHLGRSLESQALRTLEAIKEQKLFTVLGYTRFDDFLNNDPHSPMKYRTFDRRIGLLHIEGEETFDVLSSLNISSSTRKLLIAGTVQVEGDDVVIGADRIPVTNRKAVVEALKGLVAKNQQQARTIERGKKDVVKWKRKAGEAQANGHGDDSPYDQSLNNGISWLARLANEAETLPDDQREAARENVLSNLAPVYQRVMVAHRVGEKLAPVDPAEAAAKRLIDKYEDDE